MKKLIIALVVVTCVTSVYARGHHHHGNDGVRLAADIVNLVGYGINGILRPLFAPTTVVTTPAISTTPVVVSPAPAVVRGPVVVQPTPVVQPTVVQYPTPVVQVSPNYYYPPVYYQYGRRPIVVRAAPRPPRHHGRHRGGHNGRGHRR